jgi:predicted PurR-regulated permease PerM
MLRPFIVTLGLAAVFAVVFNPLKRRLVMRMPAGPAAFCTLIIGVVCVLVPASLLSVQIFNEAQSLYGTLSQPGSISQVQEALTSFGTALEPTIPGSQAYFSAVSDNLTDYARRGLSWGLGHAGTLFTGTLTFLIHLFVFMMTLYYLLKEGPKLMDAVGRFSPLTKDETSTLVARLSTTINSVVRGSLVIALLQGLLTAIGFTIFGISNSILWGSLAVVAALIPTVGTGLIFIPAVLFLLYMGHAGSAIGLAVYGFLGVGIVDNLLRPYLLGGKASIHPLLILLSVLGGIALFGPGGLFLGPLVISLLLGLLSIYAPARQNA